MLSEDQKAEIGKRIEATSPAPWVYNSYNGIFSGPMVQAYEDWSQAVPEGHTLERRGDCPVCGEWKEPRFAPSPGWGHGCQLFDEEYGRDPEVAAVPSHHGDTAIGKRAADAEFIAAARTDIPLLLETIEELSAENRALTQGEDSRLVLAEAEIKRLHSDLERYDAQYHDDLPSKLTEALAEAERLRIELDDAQQVRAEALAATYWDDGPDRKQVPTWEIRDIFARADRRLERRMDATKPPEASVEPCQAEGTGS